MGTVRGPTVSDDPDSDSGSLGRLNRASGGLKRRTMEFASRTISSVPDISHYVSEGLVSSASPRIFPKGNAVASPVRSPQPVRKPFTPLAAHRKPFTPLAAHLHPQSLRLSISAASQEAVTTLDPHVTTRVYRPSVHREAEVDCIAAIPLARGTKPANLAASTSTLWFTAPRGATGARCEKPRGPPGGRRTGGPPGRTVGNADGGFVTCATCGRQSPYLRGTWLVGR